MARKFDRVGEGVEVGWQGVGGRDTREDAEISWEEGRGAEQTELELKNLVCALPVWPHIKRSQV